LKEKSGKMEPSQKQPALFMAIKQKSDNILVNRFSRNVLNFLSLDGGDEGKGV
jgi:hypothetical protein